MTQRKSVSFEGFCPEVSDFLWGIRLNNSREWFLPRKEFYTEQVYRPLQALAWEVQARMAERHPKLPLNCKVTRIYRDTRIPRKDGPYKTELWFSLRLPEDRWGNSPCFYFSMEGGGYSVGVDFYNNPAGMEAYRRHVLRDPKPLERLAKKLNGQREFQLGGEEYKRSKGEVSPVLQGWFNRKSLWISRFRTMEEGKLTSPKLADEIIEDFEFLLPYFNYLSQCREP